jgi:hypothetical protein
MLLSRERRRCCWLGVAGWLPGGGAGEEAHEGGVADQPTEEEECGDVLL